MLADTRKKELANLFSTEDVKFVFCGKMIYNCALNRGARFMFSRLHSTRLVANSKVVNLRGLLIVVEGARLLLNINIYTCAKRELAALANPLSIQQTSLPRPAECASLEHDEPFNRRMSSDRPRARRFF